MGKTIGKPKQRYAFARPTEPRAPPPQLRPTVSAMSKYRTLSPDPAAGKPERRHGDVGSYWTVAVLVPLSELTCLPPTRVVLARLRYVRMARKNGTVLPPIEIGVNSRGAPWLIDGNHRLTEARQARQAAILTKFTFAGT